jgi:hypothetical protein
MMTVSPEESVMTGTANDIVRRTRRTQAAAGLWAAALLIAFALANLVWMQMRTGPMDTRTGAMLVIVLPALLGIALLPYALTKWRATAPARHA